ncbi:MAG TPA: AIPR family protein [Terriglobia bacterium]|nr:AIPR family protein [Terriglobia bacterium]
MNLEEFRKEILENVAAHAAANEEFRHSAFVEHCLKLLEDADEVADAVTCFYRGTGSKNRNSGVDAYSLDEADGSVRLFVADFSGKEEASSLTPTDAKSGFSKLQTFCEDAYSGKSTREIEESSQGFALASLLNQNRATVTRLRLYLLTDSIISTRIRDLPEITISGIPSDLHIWDISRFFRVFESKTGRDELVVDFSSLLPDGLHCIAASVDSTQYQAYLCVIRGDALAAIYETYGSRLLEGNVRSFLTLRGKVNKGIRNTILQRPEMFFAFNNGITCTASSIEAIHGKECIRILKAADLEIVNGAQTTASLAAAIGDDRASLKSVFVQMKLSVIAPEQAGTVIPEISRFANSQNKVSEADFFSNHQFHRRIEQISRRFWAPAAAGAQYETHWFYERARGQYLNEQSQLTPSERKKFVLLNPRYQVITKTDLAKFENTWRQLPHIVSQGAQKNFLAFSTFASAEWDRNSDQFNDDYFKRLAGKALLFRATERIVSEQPWYQGGYRANIITYALSKVLSMIGEQSGTRVLDLRQLWAQQSVPTPLLAVIEVVAKAVFDVIVTPDSAVQNVTEWCKKELCWRRAMQTEVAVDVTRKLRSLLCDRESDVELQKSSRKERRIDNGIENQQFVLQLGAVYWSKARKWGVEQSITTPDEDGILGVAAAMPRRMPTEKQSWRLIQIKEKLELEGFPKEELEPSQ